MSVGAVVVRSLSAPRDDSVPGYLPVATESEFARYWLPLATDGGLNLVSEFEPGIALKPRDLPGAVHQLEALSDLISDAPFEPAVSERILTRVADLRDLLATVGENEVEEVFIG